ncbi:hypothetical protein ACFLQ8_03730 [Candidatus Auribacterota bacterium]
MKLLDFLGSFYWLRLSGQKQMMQSSADKFNVDTELDTGISFNGKSEPEKEKAIEELRVTSIIYG